MQRLKDYVAGAGGQCAVAKRLGISQGFLSAILSGKKGIGDELAARIEAATGGQVTFLELKHPKYRRASGS